jgi:type IV pilus assembly protein PilA
MFRALHEKRKNDEGFTLIELLVVILIIAILAAIAIPVFLRQREKGWVSQAESALKNAATAMESYSTGNNGAYPAVTTTEAGTVSALSTEGYRSTNGVVVTIEAASATTGYCLEANHANLTDNYRFDTRSGGAGAPVRGDCP